MSIPRPEHPEPQAVRQDWLNLNGLWQFELDPGASGEARGWHEGKQPFTRRIRVPFCPESELSGIGHRDFMPCVWYRRRFAVPDTWRGRRVRLHFGAVDYDATVWVNGKLAGSHRGGYVPFALDITALLKPGDNTLTLRAIDDTRSPLQPTGKQSQRYESYGCYYTRTTGIWQTVWLEAVGPTHIRNLRLLPEPGRLTLLAELDGDPSGLVLEAAVTAEARNVGRARASASGLTALTVDLTQTRLWQPGAPFLYDLRLTLRRGARIVDRLDSYFGIRSLRIDGHRVLINDRPVFQRLVLDQGFYPDGIYTAPTDAALRRDIEISTAMGFNGARLHEKVFEPRFLYWADRLGYLVWGEYPNWGLDHANPLALERVLPEWTEALRRDWNHPAIVGWCPFNETVVHQNPELIRAVYRATKTLDPTRPAIDTSGYVHVETDIDDCHTYEQDPAAFAALFEPMKTGGPVWHNRWQDAPYRGQPYFVSEYGGIWWNPGQADPAGWGYGGPAKRPRTEAEFLARYRGLTEALLRHPKMFGFCYTQLYDVEQEVNGLYTYDRKAKFEAGKIREINAQSAVIEAM